MLRARIEDLTYIFSQERVKDPGTDIDGVAKNRFVLVQLGSHMDVLAPLPRKQKDERRRSPLDMPCRSQASVMRRQKFPSLLDMLCQQKLTMSKSLAANLQGIRDIRERKILPACEVISELALASRQCR